MFIENTNGSDENQISSTTISYQHPEQNNIGIMNSQEPISIDAVDSTQTSDTLVNESLEENCNSSVFHTDFNKEDHSNRSTNSVETVKAGSSLRICYTTQELLKFSNAKFCNICPDYLINNLKAPIKKEIYEEDKNSKNKCKFIHLIQNLTPYQNNCGCNVNNSLKVTLNSKNLPKNDELIAGKNFSNNSNSHYKRLVFNHENDVSKKNDFAVVNKHEEKRDRNFLRSRGENLNYNFANARQIINPSHNKLDKYNRDFDRHREEEPEWFTNPINQNDTIELRGFEDDEKNFFDKNNNSNFVNQKNQTIDNSKKFDISEIFKFDWRKCMSTKPDSNKVFDNVTNNENNTSRFARWFNNQKTFENQSDLNNDTHMQSKKQSSDNYDLNFNQTKDDGELHKSEQQLINILQKARINVDNFVNCKTNEQLIKEQAKSLTDLEADLLHDINENYNPNPIKNIVKTESDINGIFVNNSNENTINPFVMNLLGDAQKQKKLKKINYLQNLISNNSNSNISQNNHMFMKNENKPHPFMPTCVIRKIAKDKNVFNKNINESQFETVTGKHFNERAIIKNLSVLDTQNNQNHDYSNNMFIQKLLDEKMPNIRQQNQNAFTNIVNKDANQPQIFQHFNNTVGSQFNEQKYLNAQKLENIENSNILEKKNSFNENNSWNNYFLKQILIKASTNINSCNTNIDKKPSDNLQSQQDQLINQKRLIEILQKASKGIQNNNGNPINKFFDNKLIMNNEKNLPSAIKPKVLLLEEIEKN